MTRLVLAALAAGSLAGPAAPATAKCVSNMTPDAQVVVCVQPDRYCQASVTFDTLVLDRGFPICVNPLP